jgi:hypothetical protein
MFHILLMGTVFSSNNSVVFTTTMAFTPTTVSSTTQHLYPFNYSTKTPIKNIEQLSSLYCRTTTCSTNRTNLYLQMVLSIA